MKTMVMFGLKGKEWSERVMWQHSGGGGGNMAAVGKSLFFNTVVTATHSHQ